jgi:hypothetical protein
VKLVGWLVGWLLRFDDDDDDDDDGHAFGCP